MFVKTKSVPLVRSPLLVFSQNTLGGGIPDALHTTVKFIPSATIFLVIGRIDEDTKKKNEKLGLSNN